MRCAKCLQSHLIIHEVSHGKPEASGVSVMLCYHELRMIIGQIIYLGLLRCPRYIKGFFIIKLSLREGLEYCNLVPFNDNIKLKQKAIGKVLVIKIDVL